MPLTQLKDKGMQSFNRYRPRSHFIAPHSWMNDPCGIVYVEETDDYILCYQWNPGTSEGGNTAWGMARSKDLVTWTDCVPALQNGTDTLYDSKGVFSGSIVSRMVDGERILYLFYTSVSRLPIHWSKPYLEGCESQSVAISRDFGRSWNRSTQNPLLSRPPLKSETTGWRDPHVAPWPTLSAFRGVCRKTNYMMLSSGHRSQGPQLLLYESTDLLQWTELCVILEGAADIPIKPGSDICFGRNFECASFFTLGSTNYIIAGLELHPSTTTRHSSRCTIWMSGNFVRKQDKPYFEISAHGVLDPGIFYAPHVFRGSDDEYLISGWADEDENSTVQAQAWAGCLTYPREIFELRLPDDDLEARKRRDWYHDHKTSSIVSLGIRPAPELSTLRVGSKPYEFSTLSAIHSTNVELEASFPNLTGTERLVFNVRQAPGDDEVTRVIISLSENTITVDRSKSSLSNGNSAFDTGGFQLLKRVDGTPEDLHVRIWVDNSIIEVYANDRFALTSRIYPTLETAGGVSCTFTDAQGALPQGKVAVKCWAGLANAWPERSQTAIRDVVLDARLGADEKVGMAHLETVEMEA